MQVEIYRLRPDVPLPQYHTSGAVGFDLAAADTVTLAPREIALISTGLVIKTPPGYALILASRSSTPKKFGLTPPHGIGVIDQDYSGQSDEIRILVRNFGETEATVQKGDRIAQGLFARVDRAQFVEKDTAQSKSRGGFGSTG
jgi:dUTP pyrophosphatase